MRLVWSIFVVCAGLAHAQSVQLPFTPLATDYSAVLERIITVSANPSQLHVFDPVSALDQIVPLPDAPVALSIGPDGFHAAVLHGSTSVSYVDLVGLSVLRTYPLPRSPLVPDGSLVILADGWIHVMGGVSIRLADGVLTPFSTPAPVTSARLHPNGQVIYATLAGGSLVAYDISSGPIKGTRVSALPGRCLVNSISADGARIYTDCGAYSPFGDNGQDMQYYATGAPATIESVFTPPGRSGVATSSLLTLYDPSYLTKAASFAIPGVPFGGPGWVLFNSARTSVSVIRRVASAVGATDTSWQLMTNDFSNPSCTPSGVTPASLSFGGGVSIEQLSISAPSDCVYNVAANVPWIKAYETPTLSGPGTVWIIVRPNPDSQPRTGLITIGGLTVTVNQDASAPALAAIQVPALIAPSVPIGPAAFNASNETLVYGGGDTRIVGLRPSVLRLAPDELNILQPLSGDIRSIPLPKRAVSVAISPDGTHAAVGHDGWISYANLVSLTVEQTIKVPFLASAVVDGGNGYVYGLADQVYSVELATGLVTAAALPNSIQRLGPGWLHPSRRAFYVNSTPVSKWSIDGGVASFTSVGPDGISIAGLSDDGRHLFANPPQILAASGNSDQNWQPLQSLPNVSNFAAVAESSTWGQIGVVTPGPQGAQFLVLDNQDFSVLQATDAPRLALQGSEFLDVYLAWGWSRTGKRLIGAVSASSRLAFEENRLDTAVAVFPASNN